MVLLLLLRQHIEVEGGSGKRSGAKEAQTPLRRQEYRKMKGKHGRFILRRSTSESDTFMGRLGVRVAR